MSRAQWVLMRLWIHVVHADFGAYHNASWAMIKPVIFPATGVRCRQKIGKLSRLIFAVDAKRGVLESRIGY